MTYYYYKTADGKSYAKFRKPADPSWGYLPATKAEYDAAMAMAEAESAAWKAQHNL